MKLGTLLVLPLHSKLHHLYFQSLFNLNQLLDSTLHLLSMCNIWVCNKTGAEDGVQIPQKLQAFSELTKTNSIILLSETYLLISL